MANIAIISPQKLVEIEQRPNRRIFNGIQFNSKQFVRSKSIGFLNNKALRNEFY
jgi:hypothetical protein